MATTAEPEAGGDDLGGLMGLGLNSAERELGEMFVAMGDDAPADPPPAGDAPPDGAEAPAPAGDAPATGGPDAPVVPPPEPVDPLAALTKDAKPLGYKVSGEERIADYILSLGEKGAYIPPDKVARIQQALASSDANRESNRQLYETVQQYEALGGMAKVREQAEQLAAVNAVGGLLFEYLTTPDKLLSLLMLDGQNKVVPNPDALDMLRQRARVMNDRALLDTQKEWGTKQQAAQETVQERALRETAIPNAIDRAFPDAHEEDRARAKALFGQMHESLMFKAGADGPERYQVPPGTWMVDIGKMEPWFKDEAQKRSQATTEQDARAKAQRENEARQAQKPATAPSRPLPPRKADGTFRQPKAGEKLRKMTRTEVLSAVKRGEDLPEDGMVPV